MALTAQLSPSSATTSAASESFQTLATLPASAPDPIRENASASSIGAAAAAAAFELEPEREQWRNIAREVTASFTITSVFSCQDDETLHALYHYTKKYVRFPLLPRVSPEPELTFRSMNVLHPFQTARESVQNLFCPALTAKRPQPEAKASDLFVILHRMLLTNIQLDEFETILARLLAKLQLETLEERE